LFRRLIGDNIPDSSPGRGPYPTVGHMLLMRSGLSEIESFAAGLGKGLAVRAALE